MKIIALSALASLGLATAALAAPDAGGAPAVPGPGQTKDFVEYVEWVLDVRLTLAQRAEVEELIQKASGPKGGREQALVQEGVTGHADLANQTDADKRTLRPSVEDEYMKAMRRKARELPLAKWVVTVADARKPIAPGDPPLSRQSADALAELMAFVVSEAGLGKTLSADKAFRDAFAKAVAADYRSYSIEQKASVADLPRDWATLREGFGSFPDEKKQKLKKEWADALTPLLGGAKAAERLGGDAKPLREAAKVLVPRVTGWL